MKRVALAIATLWFLLVNTFGQGSVSTQEIRFSLSELQKDFSVFRGAFEEIHPGLYWHISKNGLDQQFDKAYGMLSDGMTEQELYLHLAPIVSGMGCGHSSIGLSDQTTESINENGKFLPVDIRIIGGKGYCYRNHVSDPSIIPVGSEILSINGQQMSFLIQYFQTLIPHDGYNTTFQHKMMEVLFGKLYHTAYGEHQAFEIEFLEDGQEKKVVLKALGQKQMETGDAEESEEIISLNYLSSHHTAVLTIKGFWNWTRGKKKVLFMKELKKAFSEIRNYEAKHLILDLRGNLGGSDVMGLDMLSYLIDEPILEFKKIVSRAPKPSHLSYSDGSKIYYFKNKKINDTTYHAFGVPTLKPYGPSQPTFQGELYVLINGFTFSTAADVAAQIKSRGRGTFIGEETGGGYYGNTSGSSIKIILPNTKLVAWVPIGRYHPNVENTEESGRGVFPDHRVEPGIWDILDKRDVQMDTTLELIEGNQ